MAERSTMDQFWYFTRVAICIVSFGMIFPNVLTERMETEDVKRNELVDR